MILSIFSMQTGFRFAGLCYFDKMSLSFVLLPLAPSEETFARVARALSKCPSASDGGDLGVFQPGELDPAFDRPLHATNASLASTLISWSWILALLASMHLPTYILSHNVVASCGDQVIWLIWHIMARTGVAFNPNVPIGEVVGPVPQMHELSWAIASAHCQYAISVS